MPRRLSVTLLAVTCIVSVLPAEDVETKPPSRKAATRPSSEKSATSELQKFEGLWFGSWGGGEQADGVVFQPALAKLFVEGERAELYGFRPGRIEGKVDVDTATRRLYIMPTHGEADNESAKPAQFAYEWRDGFLILTDSDNIAVTLQRRAATRDALANATVELVSASGISYDGQLLVTEYSELRAGRAGTPYFAPYERKLDLKKATILLVQERDTKKIQAEEARKLLVKATSVALAFRADDRAAEGHQQELWQEVGAPSPDGEVVRRMLSKTLRPGTLVFILSARDNVPQP